MKSYPSSKALVGDPCSAAKWTVTRDIGNAVAFTPSSEALGGDGGHVCAQSVSNLLNFSQKKVFPICL